MRQTLLFIITITLTTFLSCQNRPTFSQLQTEEKTQTPPDTVNQNPIETIIVDLNQDGTADTLVLKDKPDDPGLFKTIEIRIAGLGQFIFKASDAWDKVDEDFLKRYNNIVNSQNVFVYKAPHSTFILLFGHTYGTGRDEFSIVRIEKDNAKMILDRDLEDIIDFQDIDNNGTLDLVCYNSADRIDTINKQLGIKDAYYIFSMDSTVRFNFDLSKAYNRTHKVPRTEN